VQTTWNEVRAVIYDSAEIVAQMAVTLGGELGIPRDRRLAEATLKVIHAIRRSEA
jgi:hypothetical protein